jgi:hypothetical protein
MHDEWRSLFDVGEIGDQVLGGERRSLFDVGKRRSGLWKKLVNIFTVQKSDKDYFIFKNFYAYSVIT